MSCVYCDPKSRTMMVWWLTKRGLPRRRAPPEDERLGVIKRYYNGVAAPRTTICCSALALTTVVIIGATGPASPVIPALFPLRPVWTLALTSSLAVPPAFHGSRGYFPIDGDGFAAYDLDTGEQVWRTSARPQSKPAAGEGLVFIA